MFGTGLARYLPVGCRGWLDRTLHPVAARYWDYRTRRLAREPAGPDAPTKRRIALLGAFRNRAGVAARLLAKQLEIEGAVVTKIDVSDILHLPRNRACDDISDFGVLQTSRFDVVIVHQRPPQFSRLLLKLPPGSTDGSTLVGFFSWELDRMPASWRESIACCNLVWVPSAFVAEAIVTTFPEAHAKLRIREHRADLDPYPEPSTERRSTARRRLGIREDAVVVLTSFSLRSTFARKNPVAAIEAFRKAATNVGIPVEYLVRCLDFDVFPHAMQLLEEAVFGDPRVRLMPIGRETSSIEDAYIAADIYLSLHRSEGFGLNLAEALLVGLPVVATRWGIADSIASHPNFFGVPSRLVPVVDPQHIYDCVPGARWADPDIEFAAAKLHGLIVAARSS